MKDFQEDLKNNDKLVKQEYEQRAKMSEKELEENYKEQMAEFAKFIKDNNMRVKK